MQAVMTLRGTPTAMPTFTPGWNSSTILWIIGGLFGICGVIGAAFITARYSLLTKILEAQEALGKRSGEREQKVIERFDALEAKMHTIEGELNTSRNETLAARQEVLALRQENVELVRAKVAVEGELAIMRIENKRLSGECENMRRRIQALHPDSDMIG